MNAEKAQISPQLRPLSHYLWDNQWDSPSQDDKQPNKKHENQQTPPMDDQCAQQGRVLKLGRGGC